VFFLGRPDNNVKDYAISTARSVKDQVVSPLDDANDNRSFDGMALKDFLERLRQEITDQSPR
jgi:hypothetical protein